MWTHMNGGNDIIDHREDYRFRTRSFYNIVHIFAKFESIDVGCASVNTVKFSKFHTIFIESNVLFYFTIMLV